jgi:hypothetical protein
MSVITQLADATFSAPVPAKKSSYIAGPVFDWVFFIAAPLIALWLGVMIHDTPIADESIKLLGKESSVANIFIGTFIMAHLVIVFFRSHLNRDIFRQFPLRFTVVPLALFAAMSFSKWMAVFVSVLATWWDVYHSSLQTFGLGRIYDMKAGNDAKVGRRLDFWLNLLLYAGPILGGVTLMDHVQDFSEFKQVGSAFFTAIPAKAVANHRFLTQAVIAIGIPYLCFYVICYRDLARRGYQVSFQKVALLVFTGLCSIYTWGFNTFGEAFFIMNFFHAWQYFAIVWWTEKKNLVKTLGLDGSRWGRPLALTLLLAVGFGYGFWAEMNDGTSGAALNLILVISIMHFWYDGFVWSVRKKMV